MSTDATQSLVSSQAESPATEGKSYQSFGTEATSAIAGAGSGAGVRVAVLGSTGAIGKHLVMHLAPNPYVSEVVAITRRAGVFAGQHPKIVEYLMPDDGQFGFGEVSIGFCAVGTTIKQAGSQEAFRAVDYTLALNFARYCKEHGAREFHLISSVGADASSSNFYLRVKGEVERDISALGFAYCVVYRPGILEADHRPTFRCGEECAVCLCKYLFCCCRCGACGEVQLIKVEDVARVITYVMQSRQVHAEQLGEALFSTEDGTHIIIGSVKMQDIAEMPGVQPRRTSQ